MLIARSWSSGWMRSSERCPTISETSQPSTAVTVGSAPMITAIASFLVRVSRVGVGSMAGASSSVTTVESVATMIPMNTPCSGVASNRYMIAVVFASPARTTVAREAPSVLARSHAVITAYRCAGCTKSSADRAIAMRWLVSGTVWGMSMSRPSRSTAATTAFGFWANVTRNAVSSRERSICPAG